MFDLLLTNGWIVDGTGLPRYRADVGIVGDRIKAIGVLADSIAHEQIDVAGKIVAPGFIDAHVHGDLMLLADPLHEPAIRQGVTTYIVGQDGVAMAPASPATQQYMRRYTAGFSGNPPLTEQWDCMRSYLDSFENRTAVNVACLVPNGNVRFEVMGLETRRPTADELQKMKYMVDVAMEEGGLGLSTGLDYIPSRYADTEELIELCRVTARMGGVYVTHMRRYDPEGLKESMEEVFRIGREAGVAVHISHFNSRADIALPLVDKAVASGIDVTFDLYCYLAGSTILGMIALPAWIQEGGIEATLARLNNPTLRARLLSEWFPQPRIPLEQVRLTHVADPSGRHLEGLTLEESAKVCGKRLGDFVCDILLSSEMSVGCIVPHRNRNEEDVRAFMRHPAMMAGSDGIFVGSHPHPRGCGCFARYLGHYVRTGVWTLETAVMKLSGHCARRFQLKNRGFLQPGMAADIVVFDPDTIADLATYENGRALAVGVEHVAVNGTLVLRNGRRTAALPGRGLRPW